MQAEGEVVRPRPTCRARAPFDAFVEEEHVRLFGALSFVSLAGLAIADADGSNFLTFLYGTVPAGLDPETVRFYAWASASRNGEVFASDYAPDTDWMTRT